MPGQPVAAQQRVLRVFER